MLRLTRDHHEDRDHHNHDRRNGTSAGGGSDRTAISMSSGAGVEAFKITAFAAPALATGEGGDGAGKASTAGVVLVTAASDSGLVRAVGRLLRALRFNATITGPTPCRDAVRQPSLV